MAVESFYINLENYFTKNRKQLSLHYPGITLHRLKLECPVQNLDDIYLSSKSHIFNSFIESLDAGIPLEYISNRAYFYKTNFYVNRDVLIPRNETEILVELAVQYMKQNYSTKPCRILDVCTGSGAIGLSLLREVKSPVDLVLSDLSDGALVVAEINSFRMKYLFSKDQKISLIKSDRLNQVTGTFDIILSNPPYIKKISDRSSVHEQVLLFEPEMALFLNDSEYADWFQEFFKQIHSSLSSKGFALIEGHENHLHELKNMAIDIGFKVTDIIKDYNQQNRFLRLEK